MPDPGIPVQLSDGVPVVTTPEQIDITNATCCELLCSAVAHQGTILVVDMAQSLFCDSDGMHTTCPGAHKQAKAEGGQVRLVISGGAVRRVVRMQRVLDG